MLPSTLRKSQLLLLVSFSIRNSRRHEPNYQLYTYIESLCSAKTRESLAFASTRYSRFHKRRALRRVTLTCNSSLQKLAQLTLALSLGVFSLPIILWLRRDPANCYYASTCLSPFEKIASDISGVLRKLVQFQNIFDNWETYI